MTSETPPEEQVVDMPYHETVNPEEVPKQEAEFITTQDFKHERLDHLHEITRHTIASTLRNYGDYLANLPKIKIESQPKFAEYIKLIEAGEKIAKLAENISTKEISADGSIYALQVFVGNIPLEVGVDHAGKIYLSGWEQAVGKNLRNEQIKTRRADGAEESVIINADRALIDHILKMLGYGEFSPSNLSPSLGGVLPFHIQPPVMRATSNLMGARRKHLHESASAYLRQFGDNGGSAYQTTHGDYRFAMGEELGSSHEESVWFRSNGDIEGFLPVSDFEKFAIELMSQSVDLQKPVETKKKLSFIFAEAHKRGVDYDHLANVLADNLDIESRAAVSTALAITPSEYLKVKNYAEFKKKRIVSTAMETIERIMLSGRVRMSNHDLLVKTYHTGSRDPEPSASKLIHRFYLQSRNSDEPIDLHLQVNSAGEMYISENSHSDRRKVESDRDLFTHIRVRFLAEHVPFKYRQEDENFVSDDPAYGRVHNYRLEAAMFHALQDEEIFSPMVFNKPDSIEISPEGWVYERREAAQGESPYHRLYSEEDLYKHEAKLIRDGSLGKTQSRKFEEMMEKVKDYLPGVLITAGLVGVGYALGEFFDSLEASTNQGSVGFLSRTGEVVKQALEAGGEIESLQPVAEAAVETVEQVAPAVETVQSITPELVNQVLSEVQVGSNNWDTLSSAIEQLLGGQGWVAETGVSQLQIMVDTVIDHLSSQGELVGTSQMEQSHDYSQHLQSIMERLSDIAKTKGYDQYQQLLGK